MSLNAMMKKLLSKKARTLVKAEYLNGDLEFTEKGKTALFALLYKEYENELAKMAEKDLEEEK